MALLSYFSMFLSAVVFRWAVTGVVQIDSVADTEASRDIKRMVIQIVQDGISDMVGLTKTYRTKKKITQVVVSTLFRRRMKETNEVIKHLRI